MISPWSDTLIQTCSFRSLLVLRAVPLMG